MKKDIFTPADILIPDVTSPEKWSVIACDQFSSQKDYWERVRNFVGMEPSTLDMIIPEAYLGDVNEDKETRRIRDVMDDYLHRKLFKEVKDSFVFVERTLPDGTVRLGLVGTIDLEQYAFTGFEAAILASEGTVIERLPARIRVRRAVRLESPHIITFINDVNKTVIEPLSAKAHELPLLYDFDLMEGGGHIRGRRVFGSDADTVMEKLRELQEQSRVFMVIGDGNHSLAAAKVYWDDIKKSLSNEERETHPARRALVEVNNVYDPAVSFQAIHRVIFDVFPAALISALERSFPKGADYELRWISRFQSGVLGLSAKSISELLTVVQAQLDEQVSFTGCSIDYIHDKDSVEKLAKEERCLGLLMPRMDKSELFATVAARGVFPKKSFSVGHARDKRYYMECRKIIL